MNFTKQINHLQRNRSSVFSSCKIRKTLNLRLFIKPLINSVVTIYRNLQNLVHGNISQLLCTPLILIAFLFFNYLILFFNYFFYFSLILFCCFWVAISGMILKNLVIPKNSKKFIYDENKLINNNKFRYT